MNFEEGLRLQCLNIAALELIEVETKIDSKMLFKRAKDLFILAQTYKMHQWHSLIDEEDVKKESKKENKPVKKKAGKGMKRCPACGEDVIKTWKVHKFKHDGAICGYVWGKEK